MLYKSEKKQKMRSKIDGKIVKINMSLARVSQNPSSAT